MVAGPTPLLLMVVEPLQPSDLAARGPRLQDPGQVFDQRRLAKVIRGPRYALCKNPEDLTENQSLAQIVKLDNLFDPA